MTSPASQPESTRPTPIAELLRNALLVFVGGMFGVALRAALTPLGDSTWMSATLIMNAIGSFVLGAIIALALRRQISAKLRLLLGTGAVGGFTSYSALFVDIAWRMQHPHISTPVIGFVTVLTGPVFAYLGWKLGEWDRKRGANPQPRSTRRYHLDPPHPHRDGDE